MILHSILARKFLHINLQFLLYKVLYSERQVTYYIGLNNMAFPSSVNYITHLLVQSNTAGHHRAIGDQVDRPLLRGTDTFARKLQGFHEGLSIKKSTSNIK